MRFMASAPARVIMRALATAAGRRGPLRPLALCPRRAVVRQSGRHARARRPQRAARAREDAAARGPRASGAEARARVRARPRLTHTRARVISSQRAAVSRVRTLLRDMNFPLRSSLGKRTFWKEAHFRATNRRRAAAGSEDGPAGVPRVLRALRRLGPRLVPAPDQLRNRRTRPDRRDVRAGLALRQALPRRGGRLRRAVAVRHRPQPAAPVPQAQPDRDGGAQPARAAARVRRVRGLRARRRADGRLGDGPGAPHRGRGAARARSATRSSCASCSSSPTTRSRASSAAARTPRGCACRARCGR